MLDACIIGAGITGCAIARELAHRGFSVAAIEKNRAACTETSGLNSRVIHSGFHETPGTLKARLAFEGSKRIIQYARTRGVPFLPCGMLIAIPRGSIGSGLWKEAGALWHLWKQGRRQNIPFRFVVTPDGVRRIAPIQARAGIFIPSVAVIDIEALAQSLIQDAAAAGAGFLFDSEVRGIAVGKTHHVVKTAEQEIEARFLINAAGLCAHEISILAGGPRYQVELVRGDYYELKGGVARWNIRTLVYPAAPRHSRSKGIHFGPRTDGRLYIGPSAGAVSQEPTKELFLQAARKFVPHIDADDLQWAYAGIRPKRMMENGLSDFTIRLDRQVPPLVNLIGIDSPGLAASMGIARYVADMVVAKRGRGV
jgi:glycerol-3-phosphate dehydrogenase